MEKSKKESVLLLGSNEGNRLQALNSAVSLIEKSVGKIIKESSVYQTDPWGFTEQPDFLNKIVVVETLHSPHELLHAIKNIEKKLGRSTTEKWQSRVIDIDILYYDELILQSDELTIPHPYLHDRNFTLIPLNEIMPHQMHPVFKKPTHELLNVCADKGQVKKY